MVHLDLNDSEVSILITLGDNHRGKRITEILEKTGISKPTFSRKVKRLIELGLVTKEIRSNEGYPPPVYYRLTEKGTKILKEISKRELIESLKLYSPVLDEEDRKEVERLIRELEEKYGL